LADDTVFSDSGDDDTQIFTIQYVDSTNIAAGRRAFVTAIVDPARAATASDMGAGGEKCSLPFPRPCH